MNNSNVFLIDAGTGNLRSVYNALVNAGATPCLTSDPREIQAGGRVVLPGVGAFGKFMDGLHQRGLFDPILQIVRRGDPLLGICVGMQALFDYGEEMGTYQGLGLLPGSVVRFNERPGVKVPHTGWNQLWEQKPCPLLAGLERGAYAYFNHSYYCRPGRPGDTAALTDYAVPFSSIVHNDNLFGVQFHPEKSQRIGQSILRNFLEV